MGRDQLDRPHRVPHREGQVPVLWALRQAVCPLALPRPQGEAADAVVEARLNEGVARPRLHGVCLACRRPPTSHRLVTRAPSRAITRHHAPSRPSCLITPHHASPRLITPHHTSSHLTSSHLISPHLTSSHLISPHHTSSRLISPHLASSHLISPHHASPHLTTPHHTSSRLITPHHTSSHLITPHHTSSHPHHT